MSLFQLLIKLSQPTLMLLMSLLIFAGLAGVILPSLGYFPALGKSDWTLLAYQQLFQRTDIWPMLWLSLFTGLAATAFSVAGAILLLAAGYSSRWLRFIQQLLSPLLVIPHTAAAIALVFIFSPSGWLSRLLFNLSDAEQFTETHNVLPPDWPFPYDDFGIAIIVALTLKELPFIFLMLLSVSAQPHIKQHIQGYLRSAQTLGYHPITAFLKTALPLLYPHIRLPILAVLAFSSANIEIPIILGPDQPPTLAIAILHWFNHPELSMRLMGSAAAVVQLLLTLSVIGLWLLLEYILVPLLRSYWRNGKRLSGKNVVNAIAYTQLVIYGGLALLVLFGTSIWSLAGHWSFPQLWPQQLTLLHWQSALNALSQPLANTLVLAVTVSATAVFWVLLVLESEFYSATSGTGHWRRKLFPALLYLPLFVPGVAFLFGLVWLQQTYFADALLAPLFFGHLLYVLPYVFISLALPYRRFDQRYLKVASALGKSPWQVFSQVRLPMLFAPIMVAMALGMAISFSQYLPTLLISGGRFATLTTEAVALASGSSARLNAVYVLLQLSLPLIGFMLAWWLPGWLFRPAHPRHQHFLQQPNILAKIRHGINLLLNRWRRV